VSRSSIVQNSEQCGAVYWEAGASDPLRSGHGFLPLLKNNKGKNLVRRHAFGLICGLSVSICAAALACTPAAAETPSLDIYVLAGQSNMSGRAPLDGLPPFKNVQHVLAFHNDRFEMAEEPVAEDRDARLGPSLAFADALYDLVPRDIGLVPCAVGGTKIEQWLPGAKPPSLHDTVFRARSLFDECVTKVNAARRYGRIAGLLWYQGEFDAFRKRDAEEWPRRFAALIRGFRETVADSKLPVVFTQIGPMPKDPHGPLARLIELQGKVILENCIMVSATDLSFQSDGLHLDQRGQLTLGKRYASAIARLIKSQ
jgi:hypothetical protein